MEDEPQMSAEVACCLNAMRPYLHAPPALKQLPPGEHKIQYIGTTSDFGADIGYR